jgi:hypothetical protein
VGGVMVSCAFLPPRAWACGFSSFSFAWWFLLLFLVIIGV